MYRNTATAGPGAGKKKVKNALAANTAHKQVFGLTFANPSRTYMPSDKSWIHCLQSSKLLE